MPGRLQRYVLLAILCAIYFRFPLRAGEARAYLGLHLVDVTADRAARLGLDEERGVEILDAEKDGPADRAGIRAGDALLNFNGEEILGALQLMRLVGETPPGRKVRFQILRAGKPLSVVVTLGAKPVGYVGRVDPPSTDDWMADIPIPLLMWQNNVLGLVCEPVSGDWAKLFGGPRGLLIRAVALNSVASRSGLKVGDLMVSVGDQTLTVPQDLTALLKHSGKQGQGVRVSVFRSARPITVRVVFEGEGPAQ